MIVIIVYSDGEEDVHTLMDNMEVPWTLGILISRPGEVLEKQMDTILAKKSCNSER